MRFLIGRVLLRTRDCRKLDFVAVLFKLSKHLETVDLVFLSIDASRAALMRRPVSIQFRLREPFKVSFFRSLVGVKCLEVLLVVSSFCCALAHCTLLKGLSRFVELIEFGEGLKRCLLIRSGRILEVFVAEAIFGGERVDFDADLAFVDALGLFRVLFFL